jgi:hypothetical protein
MAELTYRALIEPIPLRVSIANAQDQEPSTACHHCAALTPDRSKIEKEKSKRVQKGYIKTQYERIDRYPDFPVLKVSARTCALCKLIRKAIRSAWAARPMEEVGVGPLSEKNSYDLFASAWDGKIRIYNAQFVTTIAESPSQSMVWRLSIDFSPLGNIEGHGHIGSEISFKVFDEQGK